MNTSHFLTPFHLSIGVKSIDESIDFFVQLLGAQVLHRDPSGYVNIDLFGNQITLKHNADIVPNLADFHFGVNLSLDQFEILSKRIMEMGESGKFVQNSVAMKPEVWDAGTPLERKKMYLRCPTGYLIELKGITPC